MSICHNTYKNNSHGETIRKALPMYVVNLKINNSPKQVLFKRSDSKRCAVDVKLGIIFENLTVF